MRILETTTGTDCSSDLQQEKAQPISPLASAIVKQPQMRRTVRFEASPASVVATVPVLREIDEDQKRSLWWSLAEYDVMSDTARNICKEIRRHPSLTASLDDAWRKTIQNSKDEEQAEGFMPHVTVDQGLLHWCSHGHSRRGLERWASKFHCSSRNKSAESCISTVIKLKLTGDELAREAARLSLSARIFARIMGAADEVASIQTHTELRRWSEGGGSHRVRPMHRSSSLPIQGLVRITP